MAEVQRQPFSVRSSFELNEFEVIPEWIEQIKAVAISHWDGFADRGSLRFQVQAGFDQVIDLQGHMAILGGVHPGWTEIEVELNIEKLEPDECVVGLQRLIAR